MALRSIRQLGDPILRTVSAAVNDPRDAWGTLDDLRDTLHDFQRRHGFGRGIAAIQIGIAQRVIYIEINGESYELINPEFRFQSEDRFVLWDDCFSFPDLLVELSRSVEVEIGYQDRAGEKHKLPARGAFAELLQHEIDHLDGILSLDRAIDPKLSFRTREYHLSEGHKSSPRTS